MKCFRINKNLMYICVFLVSCLLLGWALSTESQRVVQAGNGRFKQSKFDFCVAVRFTASEAQLSQIRSVFQKASDLIADATDGQHRFGTIHIINSDPKGSETADFWIFEGAGRASATYGKYGRRGWRVNLYYDSDFAASHATTDGPFIVAHESGHHIYGLGDEYRSQNGADGSAECAATNSPTLNFCLMDDFYRKGGTYTLKEFCVASNHDPDRNTDQHTENAKSCWETIAGHSKFSATAPAASSSNPDGLPVSSPPASQAVSFQVGGTGLRLMLVVDRSGSMNENNRLTYAKSGGALFTSLMKDSDSVGLVSFNGVASVNYPLTPLSPAVRSGIIGAINSLMADGGTNIGGALQSALAQITSDPTKRTCNEAIVLISDGEHSEGIPPASIIPSLKDERVTVFTIGVGNSLSAAGESTLQSIAQETGGKYYRITQSQDLVGLHMVLLADMFGKGLLAYAPLPISPWQTQESTVFVEPGVSGTDFAVSVPSQADDITLTLRSPAGIIISEADAQTNPNIKFISGINYRVLQVNSPMAGTWAIRVTTRSVFSTSIQVTAVADQNGVRLNAIADKESLVFPEAAIIRAMPTFQGEPVTGAALTGSASRPDGSTVTIALFDDGMPEHGDRLANDGEYAARFNNYSGNGTYVLELTSSVSGGATTAAGETLFSTEPTNSKPVPPLTRKALVSIIVSSVPAISSFDKGLQNGASGDLLLFNSLTGDYYFKRCADGFTLTGRGTITRQGCLTKLQDPKVSATIDACIIAPRNTGSATIKVTPLGPTYFINDTNITNNTYACQ